MSQADYPTEAIRVKNWFVSHNLHSHIRILDVSAKTSQDAATVLGCELGCIAKSLIFYEVETGEPVLIITSGVNRVDKTKVGEYLGRKIKTAGPEYVLEKTGYPAGGVPPVAHKTAVKTLIDEDLMQYDIIWAAAGHPNSLFPIPPSQLARLSQAEIVSVC